MEEKMAESKAISKAKETSSGRLARQGGSLTRVPLPGRGKASGRRPKPDRAQSWKNLRTPDRKVEAQDAPKGTAQVTCSALNVRSEPGTDKQRIGGLLRGQTFSYYEEKDGWLKIAYGTGVGWVSAQYTSYEAEKPTEPEKPEPGFTPFDVIVTASAGLNVRDMPGSGTTPASGSKVLGTLTSGTRVTVTGEQEGWYKIDYNGKEGWCCAAFTEKAPAPPSGDALKNAQAVIDKARSFVQNPHHPYVWGGKGQILTEAYLNQLINQYGSSHYTNIINNKAEYCNGNYRAFDCSGLCCYCYKNVLGMDISEGYGWQPNSGKAVKTLGANPSVSQLQIGDVIVSSGHFQMYRGEGRAVESCGSLGVTDTLSWNYNGCKAVYRYL